MQVKRITNALRLAELWELFSRGHNAIVAKTGFEHDKDNFFRNLIYILSLGDNGYISVAFDGDKAVGFGAGYDKTFLAGPRGFCVYAAYADNVSQGVLKSLMKAFHEYARENNVSYYLMSSLRKDAGVHRCFTRRYGFKQAAVFYRKEINNVN